MENNFLIGNKKMITLSVAAAAMLALTACGGGGGSSGGSGGGGATGEFTIQAKGGTGLSGIGGNAYSSGAIYVDGYNDIEFLKSGTVDTAFTVPSYPHEENLGTNGKTISVDTDILTVASGAEPATTGTLYMVDGRSYLCEAANSGTTCDSNSTNRVTGLKINESVTVVLGLNYDRNNYDNDNNHSTGQDEADFQLHGDLIINGTLKTAALTTAGGTADSRHGAVATDRDKGSLDLSLDNNDDGSLIIGLNGKIDTSGDDAAAANERGGDGGGVEFDINNALVKIDGSIDASGGNGLGTGIGGDGAVYGYGSKEIDINVRAALIYTGTMNASGGNGATGGNAGDLDITSDTSSYYTGSLLAMGGTGSTGNGGNGGDMDLMADEASIYNSGNVNTNGGDGYTSGGNAGDIGFYPGDNSYVGEWLNSGTLSGNGGNGANGNGGSGADIDVDNDSGNLRTSGNVYANGGNGEGVGHSGGDAGYFYLYSDADSSDYGYGEYATSGDIQISGNIEVNGGNGAADGGTGGYVYAYNDYTDETLPAVGKIQFLGYNSFDVSGGDGNTSSGDAGDIYAYTEDAWTGDDYTALPVGAIVNEVDIVGVGGYAENGTGGYGGYVDFEAEGEFYVGTTKVVNSGAIDISGGLGLSGGDSGGIYFYGHDAVENSGELTALGGDADGNATTAGTGASDSIEMYATVDISNTATIAATGGNGTGANAEGYESNYVAMYAGGTVSNSGSIYANAGDSKGVAVNGDGGEVDLFSETEYTRNTAAVIDVSEGTGGSGTEGEIGDIYFDSVNVTPNNGILTN